MFLVRGSCGLRTFNAPHCKDADSYLRYAKENPMMTAWTVPCPQKQQAAASQEMLRLAITAKTTFACPESLRGS